MESELNSCYGHFSFQIKIFIFYDYCYKWEFTLKKNKSPSLIRVLILLSGRYTKLIVVVHLAYHNL